MMAACAKVLADHNIQAQVSMEERMACGIGSCLACAVEGSDDGKGRPLHVCDCGPVFPASILSERKQKHR